MSHCAHGRPTRSSSLSLVAALCLGAGLAACARAPTAPPAGGAAHLVVRASVAGTAVRGMAVEVTAADLAVPLVQNLAVRDGTASGTVAVPAGAARTITLRAFDAVGMETHRGSATVSVRGGANPPLALTLRPLAGSLPIEATVASVAVAVTPGSVTLDLGGAAQLGAAVTDPDGHAVAGPVHWATLDPHVATVSASGRVSATGAGQTQVVAAYGGVAAAVAVTVR